MSQPIKRLRPGELLFHAGEQSEGMFVIRKGQVLVYLEKPSSIIPLAVASTGGMVGEMALIDRKPRSASAKAIDEVELTYISNEEFTRILDKIPKWFVSLMSTLSSRLRDTNEHLQLTEGKYKSKSNSLDQQYKTLRFILLIGYKLGANDPKHWVVERSRFEEEIKLILALDNEKAQALVDVLVGFGFFHSISAHEGRTLISMHSRTEFEKFTECVGLLRKKDGNISAMVQEMADLTDLLAKLAQSSVYDSFSINLKSLIEEAQNKGYQTQGWYEASWLLADLDDSLLISKSGQDVAFRVNKKRISTFVQYTKALKGLLRAA